MYKQYIVVERNGHFDLEEFHFWEKISQSIEESLIGSKPATPVLWTVPEAADFLRISDQSIYNGIYNKIFIKGKHYFKAGARVLFLKSALLDYIQGDHKGTSAEQTNHPCLDKEQPATPNQQKAAAPKNDYVII